VRFPLSHGSYFTPQSVNPRTYIGTQLSNNFSHYYHEQDKSQKFWKTSETWNSGYVIILIWLLNLHQSEDWVTSIQSF
jgi:hypothetical protein